MAYHDGAWRLESQPRPDTTAYSSEAFQHLYSALSGVEVGRIPEEALDALARRQREPDDEPEGSRLPHRETIWFVNQHPAGDQAAEQQEAPPVLVALLSGRLARRAVLALSLPDSHPQPLPRSRPWLGVIGICSARTTLSWLTGLWLRSG